MSRLYAEEQSIAAGSQFDGSASGASRSVVNGVLRFGVGTSAGLFVLPHDSGILQLADNKRVRRVKSIRLHGDGTTNWTVAVRDAAGVDAVVLSIATTADVFDSTLFDVLPDEHVRITTTGLLIQGKAVVVYDFGPDPTQLV